MKIRLALALLLLLVVGGGVGYAVGAQDEPETEARTTFPSAAPVPAANPRLPVQIIEPDPDDPALEPAIPLTTTTLVPLKANGKPAKEQLELPVPDGWVMSRPNPTRWQYVVAGNDALAYGLRIDFLGDTGNSVESAIQRREAALRSAKYQHFFTDLDITSDDSNGFEAVYVQDDHERHSVERFFPGPDGLAYATVSVYGRARDLEGMRDLLDRISIDLKPVPAQRP